MLTPEQIADGWIEHDGGLPLGQFDLIFSTGEVSLMCNTALAQVAIGINDIIAYRPENPHAD